MLSNQMFRINQWLGLNTTTSSERIEDFELVIAENAIYTDTIHEIVKRESATVTTLGALPGVQGVGFVGAIVPGVFVAGRNDGKLCIYDSRGSPVTVVSTLATHGTPAWGLTYNSFYYLLCSTGIFRYQVAVPEVDIENAVIAGSPGCIYGVMFKDRMFVIAGGGTATSIQYSAVGDPTSWPGANVIQVNPGDGFGITGLVSLHNDKLLIFKDNAIYVLYVQGTDTSAWQLKLISNTVGADCPTGAIAYEDKAYFSTGSEIYVTDGVDTVRLSQNINDQIVPYNAIASGGGFQHLCIYNRHLLVINGSYTTDVTKMYGLVYSLDGDVWYKWKLPYSSWTSGSTFYQNPVYPALTYAPSGNLLPGLLLFNYASGASASHASPYTVTNLGLNRQIPTTAGKPAGLETNTFKIRTKDYSFDTPDVFKRFKYVTVTVKGAGTVYLRGYTQDNATPVYLSSQSVAESDFTKITVLRFKMFQFLKSMQFELECVSDTTPFTVLEVTCAVSSKVLTAKVKSYA